MASDAEGRPIAEAVAAYRGADRLDPYGFSGWIGREPHGADKADCGSVRDGVFAEQVIELFGELAGARRDGPWLAVASFVNPHDIAFNGVGVGAAARLRARGRRHAARHPRGALPVRHVRRIAPPARRPSWPPGPPCSTSSRRTTPTAGSTTTCTRWSTGPSAGSSRRSSASGMAEDTVIVFTSDHGDLVGAHGGLMQKWYNAYDEAIRVPLLVKGPGVAPTPGRCRGPHQPRGHRADAARPGRHRRRARRPRGGAPATTRPSPCPGGTSAPSSRVPRRPSPWPSPLYFMTEDDVGRGLTDDEHVHRARRSNRCRTPRTSSRSSPCCRRDRTSGSSCGS